MRKAYGVLAVLLALHAASAHAADPATQRVDPPTYFDKGSFALSLTGGYYPAYESPGENLNPYTVGGVYYALDTLALGVELTGYALDAKEGADDTGAGGFNLYLRHHFFERGEFSLFGEVALGMLYADDRFPPGGTHFNFTEQFGVGMTYRLREDLFFIGGARYIHISNADIRGQDRNPSLNAVGGYVGLLFTF
jgi:hypothetical protein